MPSTLDPLVRDLILWLAAAPRPYADVMDAWRTSCPRLTVWEDALEAGYVERRVLDGHLHAVATDKGLAFASSLDAVDQRGSHAAEKPA